VEVAEFCALGVNGARRGESQGLRIVPQGFSHGIATHGIFGRLTEIEEGAWRVLRAQEVIGKFRGELMSLSAVSQLKSDADLPMPTHSPTHRDTCVEHFPVQGVPKFVLSGYRSIRPDDRVSHLYKAPLAIQDVEARFKRFDRIADHDCHRRHAKFHSHDTGRLQYNLILERELLYLSLYKLTQAFRHFDHSRLGVT
jgi:hypothetical protein